MQTDPRFPNLRIVDHPIVLDRLSKMLLTALRIAVYEIGYTEISPAVAINEAVNLIKIYDSPESASYGNGVLASYVREK